jgi:cytochrome c oxidase subunit 3
MATITPIRTRPGAPRDERSRPRVGGGGRPPVIHFPQYGGGGDGGRDDVPDFGERLKRYRIGLMVGMVSVVMLFITFSSTFLFRHHIKHLDLQTGNYVSDWNPVPLPYGLLIVNTVLLLLSSFTIEKGRRQAFEHAVVAPITALPGIAADHERQIPWVGVTAFLGLGFLAGQVVAWRHLIARGYLLAANPANSFFYLLTGLHAVHLFGGVLALGYAALSGFLPRPLERKRVVVDVAAWYWHFMAMLWLYVFAVVALG